MKKRYPEMTGKVFEWFEDYNSRLFLQMCNAGLFSTNEVAQDYMIFSEKVRSLYNDFHAISFPMIRSALPGNKWLAVIDRFLSDTENPMQPEEYNLFIRKLEERISDSTEVSLLGSDTKGGRKCSQ